MGSYKRRSRGRAYLRNTHTPIFHCFSFVMYYCFVSLFLSLELAISVASAMGYTIRRTNQQKQRRPKGLLFREAWW